MNMLTIMLLVPIQPEAVHVKGRNRLLKIGLINQIFWSGDFLNTLKYKSNLV